MKRAVGYKRVSTAEQADHGYGLPVQGQRVLDFARAEGWELAEVLEDGGASGTLPLAERDGLLAALEYVRARRSDPVPVTAVIVARFDRLGRDALESLLAEREFARLGARVLYAEGMNGEDPQTRFMRTVMHGMAELDRDMLVARLQGGRRAKKAAGGYAGGRPRLGFRSVAVRRAPASGGVGQTPLSGHDRRLAPSPRRRASARGLPLRSTKRPRLESIAPPLRRRARTIRGSGLPERRHRRISPVLASVGLTLMTMSVVVPWLFIREMGPLTISEKKLDYLTPRAREVLLERQDRLELLQDLMPAWTLLLLSSGVALVHFGARGLKELQPWEVREASARARHAEALITPQSPREREQKAREELADEAAAGEPAVDPVPMASDSTDDEATAEPSAAPPRVEAPEEQPESKPNQDGKPETDLASEDQRAPTAPHEERSDASATTEDELVPTATPEHEPDTAATGANPQQVGARPLWPWPSANPQQLTERRQRLEDAALDELQAVAWDKWRFRRRVKVASPGRPLLLDALLEARSRRFHDWIIEVAVQLSYLRARTATDRLLANAFRYTAATGRPVQPFLVVVVEPGEDVSKLQAVYMDQLTQGVVAVIPADDLGRLSKASEWLA